jgi:retinol dehydrogenase-12
MGTTFKSATSLLFSLKLCSRAQWGTHVLGHFYFTKLLLPALIAGAKASPDGHARVVNTSSSAGEFGAVDFNSFRDGPRRRKIGTHQLYSQSKLVSIRAPS